jgi:hypothetical protein
MKSFRNLNLCSFAVLLASACAPLHAATVTLSQIYVSIGPDANTSPNYAAYTTNAQTGVKANGSNEGGNIATTPSAYSVVGTGNTASVNGAQITNTPFPSWLGTADPTGALAAEKGNMIYWSIVFQGTNISLSNINLTQSSTDPLDYFGDNTQPGGLATTSFATANYAPDLVGITAANTLITSGVGTQLVNEIVITGFGEAQDGYGFGFTGTDAQQLAEIDQAYAQGLGTYAINTCYYYGPAAQGSPSSCDSTNVANALTTTPEPTAFSSLALALLVMVAVWRFRLPQRTQKQLLYKIV